MAYEEKIVAITLEANAGLATYTGVPGQPGSADPNGGHQYKFVIVDAEGRARPSNNNDTPVIGVLQNKPQYAGSAATVAIAGVSKVIAGESIVPGNKIKAGPGGVAMTRTDSVSDHISGIALTSGAVGEVVSILLLFTNPTPWS